MEFGRLEKINKIKMKNIVIALLIFVCFSCTTNKKEYSEIISDTTEIVKSEIEKMETEPILSEARPQIEASPRSANRPRTEAMEAPVYEETRKEIIPTKEGSFGLHCDTIMKINSIYDVFGLFTTTGDLDYITETIINDIEEHSGRRIEQTISTYDQVEFYEIVELVLIDPTKKFEITEIHTESKQRFRGKDLKWHWKVKPTSVDFNSQLLLRLNIYDNDGYIDDNFSKTYRINVKSDSRNLVQQFVNYLYENPTWLLTTIIIPLVIFLYKEIKKRYDKD